MRRMGGMLVPASAAFRTLTRETDEFQREVDGFMSALRSGIPGASQELPIKRDFLGQPVSNLEYASPVSGTEWLSPFQVGRKNEDPVYGEVARLQKAGLNAAPVPGKRIARNNASHKMTGEEYSRFLELYGNGIKINGKTAKQALDQLVSSGRYKGLQDDQKAEAIKATLNAYNKKARDAIIKESEGIRKSLNLKAQGLSYLLGI